MGVPNYGNKEQCPTSIRKPGDWFGRGADPKHCGARATEFSIRKGIRSYNCLRLVFTQCFAARPEVSKSPIPSLSGISWGQFFTAQTSACYCFLVRTPSRLSLTGQPTPPFIPVIFISHSCHPIKDITAAAHQEQLGPTGARPIYRYSSTIFPLFLLLTDIQVLYRYSSTIEGKPIGLLSLCGLVEKSKGRRKPFHFSEPGKGT
ncbi:uncharacterized protein LOC113460896 isoform X3 [Zonotrichia albicollis]|uniref:uncharacterized protein LOC113460896 isoform X3 n=1 Tax=Zonotrichia albicollis TaxID=44394 RepID=UPI003D811036